MNRPGEPVQLVGVGDYPFLLDRALFPETQAVQALGETEAAQAELSRLLYLARRYFWQGALETAERHYQRVFSTYRRLGSISGRQRETYFAALLEFGWVRQALHRQPQATRLFNEELLSRLPVPGEAPEDPVRRGVLSLQGQQRLPTPEDLSVPPDPEALIWLGKLMASHNQRAQADMLMRFAQVAYGWRQLEIAQWMDRFENGPAAPAMTPQQLIRYLPVFQWLHFAPTQGPFPYDYQRAAADYRIPADAWTPGIPALGPPSPIPGQAGQQARR